MNILLTGANGYLGRRLLPVLVNEGHQVHCVVRDRRRFNVSEEILRKITIHEVDFSYKGQIEKLPKKIDAAYYLLHSMTTKGDFFEQEKQTAKNFAEYAKESAISQIIYVGGISNQESLSRHLGSRKNVENELKKSGKALTVLRAGIIVGSGSASYEIIRDLVEKLPVMVAPKWLKTKSQPIALRNVISYMSGVLGNEKTYNKTFDIGGPDILTYKEMLLKFAEARGLKRSIITVPVMTPRLSSYWLYFITSTSYNLAKTLVSSMKTEVVCKNNDIRDIVKVDLIDYKTSIKLTFEAIEQNTVISSWKDAMVTSSPKDDILSHINVPKYGCFVDHKEKTFTRDVDEVLENIWSIGGERGWYQLDFLWKLRGYLDTLFGGVGLRRGRRDPHDLQIGDALDFWRVLLADKKKMRLLLYAEMKLPGEAWLEYKIDKTEGGHILKQTATFRPKGLWGRIYWYLVYPFHKLIFEGMVKNIIRYKGK